MQPLVYPERHKANCTTEYPSIHSTFNSNGTKSRSEDWDFVDMSIQREYKALQDRAVSPSPLPKIGFDELDSPTTKQPMCNVLKKDFRGKPTKKKLPRKTDTFQVVTDYVDYELGQVSFTYFDIFIYVVSIGSYVADVGSDCWVAYMYYSGRYDSCYALPLIYIQRIDKSVLSILKG